MIKFFRKIRQNLLSEGKTGKYMKYAIGEIVLVVIGILIALSINNWNENRKAYSKSKNYLTEMLKDLESDTLSFNTGIRGISEDIQIEAWALMQPDYRPIQVDSLWESFGGWYYNYSINDRTFQKIQNASESNLIGFESVYNSIINYYSVLNEILKGYSEWDVKEVMERQTYMKDLEAEIEMSNIRLKNLSKGQVEQVFPTRQDSTEQTQSIIAFANSTRGRNHFKNNYARHIRLRNKFKEIVQEANSLISEINKELKEN